ncbi:MAG: hypothetical protein HZB38_00720 [Planctomycetes bacterium]|nr:hypothetical protein [Planctomycetota bacterium]
MVAVSMRAHRRAGLIMFLTLVGCTSVPDLPDSADVATSAAASTSASRDTGPAGLASSTWSLTRKDDPAAAQTVAEDGIAPPGPYGGILSGQGLERPPVGQQIFRVEFGPNGQMLRVSDNRYFLANIYGADIPVGETWTAATLPGVAYRSASFGLQVGDRFGVAVFVQVRFGAIYLGRAVLYSWGTVNGDQLDGQFGYLLDFSDGLLAALGQVADQYPASGERVSE